MQNVAGGTQPPTLAPGGMGTNLADVPDISAESDVGSCTQCRAAGQTQNRTGAGSAFMNEAMLTTDQSWHGAIIFSDLRHSFRLQEMRPPNGHAHVDGHHATAGRRCRCAGLIRNTPNLNTNHTALDQLGPARHDDHGNSRQQSE